MYAQLGSTLFDGLKSFVSFSCDEEAIIVEHALIGRKPKLQGAGLGLRNLTLSLFLHQEFCVVADEIAALRTSKDTFEILSLLWGNGTVEGDFVIKQLTQDHVTQDEFGNLYAANLTVVLLESVQDNRLDQAQQDAQNNAFANGDKKPAAKSNRKNRATCQKQIADAVSSIRSNGGNINDEFQGFNRQVIKQNYISLSSKTIVLRCADIIVATDTTTSCVYDNDTLRSAANNVRAAADGLKRDIYIYTLSLQTLRDENTILQASIAQLVKVAATVNQKAIIP